jgi:hypothetical protein
VPVSFWQSSESVGLLLQPISNILNAIAGHVNLTKVCGMPNTRTERCGGPSASESTTHAARPHSLQ